MQILFSILMALVTLGVLVTIHEYGHYWVARRCGVQVLGLRLASGAHSQSGREKTEPNLRFVPSSWWLRKDAR